MTTAATSRKNLIVWLVAIVAVGALTFLLLSRNSDSPVRESGPATTGVTGSGSDGSPGTGEPGSESTLGPDIALAPEGTAAGQSAYPTYLGGDFDDTTPNTYGPLGPDEFGCDQNYAGACVPSPPAETSCASIGVANFEIVLGDPQGLDGPDQDGIACDDESVVEGPEPPDVGGD